MSDSTNVHALLAPQPIGSISGALREEEPRGQRAPKIYLAGPAVFLKNTSQYFKSAKALVAALGYIPLSPWEDQAEGAPALNPQQIYQANLELIRQCDCVVADVTPFRGTEPDSGTCFEIGFAKALGKQVVLYALTRSTVLDRTAEHFLNMGHAVNLDTLSGETVFPDNYRAEDFDNPLNLMLYEDTHFVYGTLRTAIAMVDQLDFQAPLLA